MRDSAELRYLNNGTHDSSTKKEDRAKNAIYLKHGRTDAFGENNEYGLMQEGSGSKSRETFGENGITWRRISSSTMLHCMDNTLQLEIALMEGPDFPDCTGVIRDGSSYLRRCCS